MRFLRIGRGALRAWYLTEAGADLAESIPDRGEDRRKVLDACQASGPLQAHTLAVNEVGLAFLRAARERGDEFSAPSWRHEVAHPIGPAPGMRRGELLITDAVFAYLLVAEHEVRFQYRFLELDRGTMPLDKLARKLARYARLYRFRPRAQHRGEERPPPAWEAHYPAFPAILVCSRIGLGPCSSGAATSRRSYAQPSPSSRQPRACGSPSACLPTFASRGHSPPSSLRPTPQTILSTGWPNRRPSRRGRHEGAGAG